MAGIRNAHRLWAVGLGLALYATGAAAYDGLVEKKTFEMGAPFTMMNGATVAQVKVGYETIGTLNAAGDNAILIPHFFSGNSHFAGRYKESDAARGYWDAIVGPGKPLDTDKYFLIGVDSLANVNAKDGITVTTGPASIDPATGKPYGMRFPQVQIRDSVNVQKALLDKLGVKKLYAVMGASMGSMQAYEWAAAYPQMVERIIPVIPSASADGYTAARLHEMGEVIGLDPKWNKGDYYGGPEPLDGLTIALRLLTWYSLSPEWADKNYGRKWADPARDPGREMGALYAVEAYLNGVGAARAKALDANSVIYTARASEIYSVDGKATVAEGLRAIKAKVLLLPSVNDQLLLPEKTREVRDLLKAQGNQVEYFELQGPMGHLNGVGGIAPAGEVIRKFLAQ